MYRDTLYVDTGFHTAGRLFCGDLLLIFCVGPLKKRVILRIACCLYIYSEWGFNEMDFHETR
jgi:hypothetical protein